MSTDYVINDEQEEERSDCQSVLDQNPENNHQTHNDDANIIDEVESTMKEFEEKGFIPIVSNTMFKNPHDDEAENDENKTVVESGMSRVVVDLNKLPPLPEPNYATRRQETQVGISVVGIISLICIGITHGVSLHGIGGIEKNSTTWWVFLIAIYSEAILAGMLLMALLWSDPGVVQRSKQNTFPVPLQCETWIEAYMKGIEPSLYATFRPKEKYITSSDPNQIGDSYCVRCLVWRRRSESHSYFHCNICQRCVINYDHHCSVFGRCIGGSKWKGNYKFFIGLIVCGILGCMTSVICLLWNLSRRYRPYISIPVALVLFWIISGCVFRRNTIGVCRQWRHCFIDCTAFMRQRFRK